MSSENFRTIWLHPGDPGVVQIIDQRRLPHDYHIHDLTKWQDGVEAIVDMYVRGAPLIGATAAWSLYLAALHSGASRKEIATAATALLASRPTAVNLKWAVDRVMQLVDSTESDDQLVNVIRNDAEAICNEDIEICLGIGRHGLTLIEEISKRKNGATVNVLTHCNAGALATSTLR